MQQTAQIAGYVTALLGVALIVVGILAFGWLIWKRAVFAVQAEAIKNYAEALEAANAKIQALTDRQVAQDKELAEVRSNVAELRGIVEGKDKVIAEIIQLFLEETDRCVSARQGCANRMVPTV